MKKWVILLVFWAWPAHAQIFKSGNDIYSLCTSDSPSDNRVCLHYILGVTDAFSEINAARDNPLFCIRPTMTARQIHDVVKNFLDERPADRDAGAPALVLEAIQQAFPCPAK